MKGYADRLAWAMKCQGLDPTKDQSRVAALIGKPCKPQNIQHLLDPENGVEHSKYTLDLARVLNCDPFWLGRNTGTKPVLNAQREPGPKYQYSAHTDNVAHLATIPSAQYFIWPFRSFTLEQFNALDDQIKRSFEEIISASIGNRGHPEKNDKPANKKAAA